MLLPGIPWIRLGLAAAALAAAAAGGWAVEHWRLGAQIATMKLEAAEAAKAEGEAARETERMRALARDRSLDRAHTDLQAAERSAAVAHDAADQLRDAARRLAYQRDAASGAGTVTAGQNVAGPGLVPADMRRSAIADVAASLAEIAGAGADLAAALAKARVANEQCQREYAVMSGAPS